MTAHVDFVDASGYQINLSLNAGKQYAVINVGAHATAAAAAGIVRAGGSVRGSFSRRGRCASTSATVDVAPSVTATEYRTPTTCDGLNGVQYVWHQQGWPVLAGAPTTATARTLAERIAKYLRGHRLPPGPGWISAEWTAEGGASFVTWNVGRSVLQYSAPAVEADRVMAMAISTVPFRTRSTTTLPFTGPKATSGGLILIAMGCLGMGIGIIRLTGPGKAGTRR